MTIVSKNNLMSELKIISFFVPPAYCINLNLIRDLAIQVVLEVVDIDGILFTLPMLLTV